MYPDPLGHFQHDNTKHFVRVKQRRPKGLSVLLVKRMSHRWTFCTIQKIPSGVQSTEIPDVSTPYNLQNSPKHSSHQPVLSSKRIIHWTAQAPYVMMPRTSRMTKVLALGNFSTSLFFLQGDYKSRIFHVLPYSWQLLLFLSKKKKNR